MKIEKENVELKIAEIVAPVVEGIGLELVDVEYIQDGGYWFVRIYIDNENSEKGIDLDECTAVSRAVENQIDAIIEEKFFLEVSSPGLERPLKKEKDFIKFQGGKVSVKLKHKLDEKKSYEGILKKYENGKLYLLTEEKEVEIPVEEIKKANLIFEFGDTE